MYVETPNVPGTTESRISALRESKELLKGEPEVTTGSIFGGGATKPGQQGEALDLIRLATYIETGHDYLDLHVEGKRRPIVRNMHVTVMAPQDATEGLEHLLSHIGDGSFSAFMEDLMTEAEKAQKPETADPEKSADN